jgi:glucose/arabinose dehydrogenase
VGEKARRHKAVSVGRAVALLALAAPAVLPAQEFSSARGPIRVVTVARGLEHPWGLAFLPDGRMLVTERPGRLRLVARDGTLSAPLAGVPRVEAGGQGGLLDVTLAPDFATSRIIYLSYSEPGRLGVVGTTVARARLGDAGLEGATPIFQQNPKVRSGIHFGSRLVFGRDGNLFITTGERGRRDDSQDLDRHLGKVIRVRPDGSVPPDNPFVNRRGARPEIWSYGHRNLQGAALHPETGQLWTVEHGAQGGDEVNAPRAGRNYGWPVITYGRDYSGAPIGEGTTKPGMAQPIHYWDPSIAPSGMAFYTGDRFPEWRGSLFVGSLKFQLLVRLVLNGERVVREERLLQGLGSRVRDVRQGPDGLLYLLTDESDGRILRIEPAR